MDQQVNQAKFEGWARVEVMGHQSHTGFVTTEAYGQAVMFRIDTPEIPAVGSGSIYRIVPCTEDVAMRSILSGAKRPLSLVRLPDLPLLAEPAPPSSKEEDDDGLAQESYADLKAYSSF